MDIEDLLEIAYLNDLEITEDETYESLSEKFNPLLIKDIPLEEIMDPIMEHVVSFLPTRDFLNLTRVDKRFSLLTKDDFIWKSLYLRDYKKIIGNSYGRI